MIKPALRYPGGKWKALPQILPLLPDGIEDYRTPFLGGGSDTLGFIQSPKSKDCKRIIVGDLASEIWAFWKGIQENPAEAAYWVHEWFNKACPTRATVLSMSKSDPAYQGLYEQAIAEAKALWDWTQAVDCTQLSLTQRAARTFIVNRISFSAMGDSGTLSKDQFMEFNLKDTEKMAEVSSIIQKVEILNASFQETMANPDKDKTFIFLDPPYIAQEGSGLYGRNGDTHHGFPHQELADLCKRLPCKWLMTLDDSIKTRRLYRGCYFRPFHIPYTMAGKTAEDALAGEELFIANYDIEENNSMEDLADIL